MSVEFNAAQTLRDLLASIVKGDEPTEKNVRSLFRIMLGGAAPLELSGALLSALAMREVTGNELAILLAELDDVCVRIDLPPHLADKVVDMSGTGGDRSDSINVSSMAALVVAACGIPVVKHGLRARSSRCGSADFIEGLGISIEQTPQQVIDNLEEVNFAYCHSPSYHPMLQNLAPLRKSLGIETIFDIALPLANPAGVRRTLVGVSNSKWLDPMVYALMERTTSLAWVVYGNGLDEIAIDDWTDIRKVEDSRFNDSIIFRPTDAGLAVSPRREGYVGGTLAENLAIARDVFEGTIGPARNLVVLNAAAGLVIGGGESDMAVAALRAKEAIDSKAVLSLISRLV